MTLWAKWKPDIRMKITEITSTEVLSVAREAGDIFRSQPIRGADVRTYENKDVLYFKDLDLDPGWVFECAYEIDLLLKKVEL